MSYFAPPGFANSSTGFVRGGNRVGCPSACKLSTGTPIANKTDNRNGRDNIYDINDIPSYYCVVNSGPPIPHTTRPDDYNQSFFWVSRGTGESWDNGEVVSFVSEDEPYNNPRTDYMYNAFNATVSCEEDSPVSGPPQIPHGVPRPPSKQPFYCNNLQQSLTWFRLKNK